MDNYEEKISLLTDMIAFSVVDGKLHKKEYDFLRLIARDLRIEEKIFDDLFHRELHPLPIRSEFGRIQQFYRLALLMHVDGVLHEKEERTIIEASLNMGLNPSATRRVLRMMKESPSCLIAPDVLLDVFREQQN